MTASPGPADAPIGILDSGLGGLAVYRAVRRRLPHESVLYFADTAFCPYGARPTDQIIARVERVTAHLIAQGAKAIAVACNTATVGAVAALRAAHDLPIVGVEPGIKPAALASRSRSVLLLATPGTLESRSVATLREAHGVDLNLIGQPCPGLVESVEAGDVDGPGVRGLLRDFLRPVERDGADVVILGCTHFIFLAPLIRELVGPAVELIEPSDAVALQLARRLAEQSLLAPDEGNATARFETSALQPGSVSRIASELLGTDIGFETSAI